MLDPGDGRASVASRSFASMAEPITEAQFASSAGVEGWRPLYWGAKTLFETGDFATGARLVAAIAEQADALGHAPLVDLRPDTVSVQVITIPVGLTDLDLELARRITAAAAELGLTATPAVQQVELAFDVVDQPGIAAFWKAALGYAQVAPDILVEPNLAGSAFSFRPKAHVPPRNRIHVDVSVPHDQAQARVDAILAAGGRMLGDKYAPGYWSLIDAEGNVVDIATWQEHDDSSGS